MVSLAVRKVRSTTRDVGRRHAEGHAGELALDVAGSTSPTALAAPVVRRDDVDRRRAAAAPVLLGGAVHRLLRRGVGVDRGHQAGLDADAFLQQHVDDGREAVGRAGGVGDDVVLGRVVLALVDAHDEAS